MSSNSNSSGGIGFLGALFLLFLGLKLGGVIDWSWWWVTAPIWGVFALGVVILLVAALISGIVAMVSMHPLRTSRIERRLDL